MRAVTLNNGGGYAATYNATSLTSVSKKKESTWAIYTVPNTTAGMTGSLTEFIEIPNNMSWQHSQSAQTSAGFAYNLNSDALDYGGNGTPIGSYTANGTSVNQAGYKGWANDTLWLPSIAEIGTSGENGLWKISENQRSSGTISWTRSASYNYYHCSYVITATGNNSYFGDVTSSNGSASPAFHLNLKKASQSTGISKIPAYNKVNDKNDNIEYYSETSEGNPEDKTFKLNYVNKDFVDVKFSVEYLNSEDLTKLKTSETYSCTPSYENGGMSFKVKDVGKYTVKVKPKTDQYWADGTTEEKTYTYTLKYKLKQLAWNKNSSTDITETYNGEYQYLTLKNYNKDIVKFLTLSSTSVKVKEDSGKIKEDENGTLYAIKVKDYVKDAKVTVELKNTSYMVWDEENYPTASKELKYTVSKKKLTATPLVSEWKIEANDEEEKNRTFYLWIDGICKEEDLKDVSFAGYYKEGSDAEKSVAASAFVKEGEEYVSEEYVKDGETYKKYKLKITLPKISKGDYTYILKSAATSSKNYYLEKEDSDKFEKAFSVDNKSIDIKEEDIVWEYKNYLLTNSDFKKIEAGENITVKTSGSEKIFNVTYNGYEFSFKVDTDSETSKLKQYVNDVDFTISIEGNSDTDKTIKNVKLSGSDVTHYTVKLKVTAKNNVSGLDIKTSEFTLKWQINKALFDLSGVKWDYSKAIEYDEKFHTITLVESSLPKGLAVNEYTENKKNNVNSINDSTKEIIPYTATVTFKFNNSALEGVANNYVLPKSGEANRSTYICKEDGVDKAFPFTLNWEIKKCVMDLEELWEKDIHEDKNEMSFAYYKLTDATVEARIDYEYYKDNNGELGDKVDFDDIEVDVDAGEVVYWVVAKVKTEGGYDKNYEIKEDTKAKSFKVGSTAPLIKIEMDKTFVYDGKAHGGEWKKTQAGIERVIAKYYSIEMVEEDGEEKEVRTLLDTLPTKVGKYYVKFSLEEGYEESYMLSKGGITYEIIKVQVEVSDGNKTYAYDGTTRPGEIEVTSDNYDLKDIQKTYYKGETVDEDNKLADGELPKNAGKYLVVLSVKDSDKESYEINKDCAQFVIEITKAQITITQSKGEYEYDGNERGGAFTFTTGSGENADSINIVKTYYKGETVDEDNKLADGELPKNVGKYLVVMSVA
ncbi:MAG: hypothetical protein K2J13_00155, partial [Clostridia bacterium]|nr:hypothetical protein [Clostridia bacterium]